MGPELPLWLSGSDRGTPSRTQANGTLMARDLGAGGVLSTAERTSRIAVIWSCARWLPTGTNGRSEVRHARWAAIVVAGLV